MNFGLSVGGGAYEQWTTRLRAWSRDPSTSLEGLPSLTEDTFDQETFLRLMRNVNEAIGAFMESWKSELSRALAHAHTTHALGTELVRLRQILRARLRIAEHPGWPAPIRDALFEGLRTDLTTLQSELEAIAGRSTARGSFDRSRNDEIVALIRRNPLTSILPPPTTVPSATPRNAPAAARTARRIIF